MNAKTPTHCAMYAGYMGTLGADVPKCRPSTCCFWREGDRPRRPPSQPQALADPPRPLPHEGVETTSHALPLTPPDQEAPRVRQRRRRRRSVNVPDPTALIGSLKGRPMMMIHVNNAEIRCLVDTGAETSLLKDSALDKIVREGMMTMKENRTMVSGLSGQPVRTIEALAATIRLGDGFEFKMDLPIISDRYASFPGACLFGINVLRAFNYKLVGYTYPQRKQYLVLNGHKTVVYYPEQLNPDGSIPEELNAQVVAHLSEDTLWLPRTGRWIGIEWADGPVDGPLLVTTADGGVTVPPAIYYVGGERRLSIWTVNELDTVCTLKEGSPIALTENLDCILADTEELNLSGVLEMPRYCLAEEWDDRGVAPNSPPIYPPLDGHSGPHVAAVTEVSDSTKEEEEPCPLDGLFSEGADQPIGHLSAQQEAQIEHLVALH